MLNRGCTYNLSIDDLGKQNYNDSTTLHLDLTYTYESMLEYFSFWRTV